MELGVRRRASNFQINLVESQPTLLRMPAIAGNSAIDVFRITYSPYNYQERQDSAWKIEKILIIVCKKRGFNPNQSLEGIFQKWRHLLSEIGYR